jgi:hypothetical protein
MSRDAGAIRSGSIATRIALQRVDPFGVISELDPAAAANPIERDRPPFGASAAAARRRSSG